MDQYVYFIGSDGHIQSRIGLVCRDDEEAMAKARQFVDGHAVEIWQQARKVARFESKD